MVLSQFLQKGKNSAKTSRDIFLGEKPEAIGGLPLSGPWAQVDNLNAFLPLLTGLFFIFYQICSIFID
jgi:hypothetical protein